MSCINCPTIPYMSRAAHCTVCHETFSTPNNFDEHRRFGKCLLPDANLGMVKRDGLWRKPLDERQRDRLAAWRKERQ